MKNKALVLALTTALLTVGASASAQHYDVQYDDRNVRQVQYERDGRYDRDGRDGRDGRYERDGRSERGQYRDSYRGDNRYRQYSRHTRGAGPDHNLRPGDRLPQMYWSGRYHVRNWERARLPAPMYGSNWIRAGDDFIQSSPSTGKITAVLLRR